MKTYIAQIETTSGYQQTQIAALNIQDAQAQIESRQQAGGDKPIHYSIQEQHPQMGHDAGSLMLVASGEMFACIVVLAFATHYINCHFRNLMRNRK